MAGNDDLPCIEVAGVTVFTYLDPDTGAVGVSVDLDTTEAQLVRPDGTVPLRIDVQDTVVLEDTRRSAPVNHEQASSGARAAENPPANWRGCRDSRAGSRAWPIKIPGTRALRTGHSRRSAPTKPDTSERGADWSPSAPGPAARTKTGPAGWPSSNRSARRCWTTTATTASADGCRVLPLGGRLPGRRSLGR